MADILDIILKAILTSAAGAFVGAVVIWVKGMLKRQKEFESALKALAACISGIKGPPGLH